MLQTEEKIVIRVPRRMAGVVDMLMAGLTKIGIRTDVITYALLG